MALRGTARGGVARGKFTAVHTSGDRIKVTKLPLTKIKSFSTDRTGTEEKICPQGAEAPL